MSAWAANTYVKVTSLDQLEIGKKYILVNEEANVGMGPLSNTSTVYGTTVDITIANDAVDIEGTGVLELTAHKANGEQGGWIFEWSTQHYLVWTSGNSLNSTHNTTGIASTNEQWYATSTDNGVVLKNRYEQTRVIQYNASSPRFACYTSNQKPAVLYVEGVPAEEGITTLSQANALEDGENFTFDGNAVVTYQVGNYLFLRDESGYGQVRGALNDTFQNGQVLNPGWEATKTSNDGWVWYTDAAGISASGETNAELAAPQELTGAPDESMINAYVYIKKVTLGMFPPRNFRLPDNTTIAKTEVICGVDWDLNNTVTLYGIICKVDGTLKFNAVGMHPYVEPEYQRGDVNMDGDVNITDAIDLINYLLNDDDTGINMTAADCNLDTDVNISDATALIGYLLNGTW